MCRPKWSFLLMYGSHDMRHTVFHRLTVVKGTPRDLGCHTTCPDFCIIYDEVSNGNCHHYKKNQNQRRKLETDIYPSLNRDGLETDCVQIN